MSKRTKTTTLTGKRSYMPITRPKSKRQNTRLSPLSPYMGTFNTKESIEDNDFEMFENNDEQFDQQELAQVLKTMYMKNHKSDIFLNLVDNKIEFRQKFGLSGHNFNKPLMYPATLINILTRLNNLQMYNSNLISKTNPNFYQFYGSITGMNTILTIIDTIGIKTLYLINEKRVHYLSPLNIRKIRDVIRKHSVTKYQALLDSKYVLIKSNKDLRKKFSLDITKNTVDIAAKDFDMIIISSTFSSFSDNDTNISVTLNNFDYKDSHKSSMLKSNIIDDITHLISVNKCYNFTVVNTTWKPFNSYIVDNFTPGANIYYYLDSDNSLHTVSAKDIVDKKMQYYSTHFNLNDNIHNSLSNIHFFSSKLDSHKSVIGGSHLQTIPEVSVCSDIYFPNNTLGFCWFSAIINSLFYADDISTIFLNKTVRHMDKTLEYIKDFYDTNYQTFDINNQQHLKEFTKHLIHLMTFVYCSFSILSKNQLNRIQNKRKWMDIYTKITKDYYPYIYIFIIALSNPKK